LPASALSHVKDTALPEAEGSDFTLLNLPHPPTLSLGTDPLCMMTVSSIASPLSCYQTASALTAKSYSRTDTSGASPDSTARMSKLSGYMKQLDELRTSDPVKFKQVMSQISEQLQKAADAAGESEDTRQATMLSDLADKFATASRDGSMPDLQPPDGMGPQGAPPMGPPPGPPPENTAATSSTLSSTASGTYNSLLALFNQNSGSDPLSTLTSLLDPILSTQQF
jgi:hypothetical protein